MNEENISFEPLEMFIENKEVNFMFDDYPHADYYRKLSLVELSIRVIYDFYHYHIDCECNEFPMKLYKKLQDEIAFLSETLNSHKCPSELFDRAQNALEDGRRVLSQTKGIEEEPAPTPLKLESKTVKMEEFPVKKCERHPDGTILIQFYDKDELEKITNLPHGFLIGDDDEIPDPERKQRFQRWVKKPINNI